MKTAAVFVHGLWLNGAEFTLLRRRLAASHGFTGHRFSYRSVGASIDDIVRRLTEFVDRIEADRVHFVAHSLGGVVLCRYFERVQRIPAGRVVFLGSPTVASQTAKNVARVALLAPLLGRTVADELVNPCAARTWNASRELGCIAGTRPMGLGRLFSSFDEESDGTVAVSETKLPGHTAHLTLPVSHTGMLLSPLVAGQVGEFLANGRFNPVR
ncbi:MAG TPA: alpha/beta fold hydrolase [Steroidobacteraceae bacterium]|jgi:pimeloyl-ACP methyl ester carboxylesterase|nr:alpha/beta fold hydrolase [Steroidobacteraceae bacterium]